jgi:tetratricopeptide (TPR) repeat protein
MRAPLMMRWTWGVGVVVVSLGMAGCAKRDQAAAPAGRGPDACAAALAPGRGAGDLDRAIGAAQQDARKGARNGGALERLGYLFVARARVGNDPGDYTLAEKTAECLDARQPGQAAAMLLRGHVLHQLHRFAEAERIARTLVAMRTFPLDYGLLGDALMEQGRLSEAGDAYQKMLDLKPFFQSYTRAAHLRWLKGDLDSAMRVMRLAIAAASPRDKESSAWAWTRMSAYELQAGRFEAAETAAASALRYQPDYAPALLAQGRILLASGRAADAVPVLRRAAELNPLPEYHWILADALRLLGLAADAATVEQEIVARGGTSDPRTLALYLATRGADPARALALADDELRTRADVFTLDARAWALAASGRVAEADQMIARALAEGTNDARLFLHAGVIHAAAGRKSEARRWLKKADALRAMLLPSEAAELTHRMTADTPTEED